MIISFNLQNSITGLSFFVEAPKVKRLLKLIFAAFALVALTACGSNQGVIICTNDGYSFCHGPIQYSKMEVVDNILNHLADKTNQATISDIDGTFTLEFNKKHRKIKKVFASYLGYRTLEIPLSEARNKEVNIKMGFGLDVINKPPFHKRLWNGISNI